MFETEIKLPTFLFICLETVIFFFQLANYLFRRQDKSRSRFLLLITTFIFYNVCSGFLPDPKLPIHMLIQNIFSNGSGIVLATYYFYYLVKELNISQQKLFNTKILLGSLVASMIALICTYGFSRDIQLSRQVFITFPMLVSVYFCALTVRFLVQDNRQRNDDSPYKLMVYSGYIGVIFMATMPIIAFFGDYQIINNSLVNVSFALAFYAYVNYSLYQNKIEYEILQRVGYFAPDDFNKESRSLLDLGLTTTELHVAYLLIKGYSHQEIADSMYIALNTATKHASNIFKKTDCENKKTFVEKFKMQKGVVEYIEKNVIQTAV